MEFRQQFQRHSETVFRIIDDIKRRQPRARTRDESDNARTNWKDVLPVQIAEPILEDRKAWLLDFPFVRKFLEMSFQCQPQKW